MNLNDRVALLLGRAIIRAEEMTVRLEQAQTELKQLRENLETEHQHETPQPD
jgi:HAMP domain-containing protein